MVRQRDKIPSTGIEPIDFQHQEILRLVGELRNAINEGWGRARQLKTIQVLEEYIDGHCAVEDLFLEKAGSAPAFTNGTDIAELQNTLAGFKSRLASSESAAGPTAPLDEELIQKISSWLSAHTKKIAQQSETRAASQR